VRIAYGIIITTVVFLASTISGSRVHLNNDFLPATFLTHTLMLILSVICIFVMKKAFSYRLALPDFKSVLMPVVYGVATAIIINVLMTVVTKLAGGKIEGFSVLAKMNPVQVLIFVFFYASIAEEMLFRGFLLNLLTPLKSNGYFFFKTRISLPVIVSAVMFGLAHLIVITTGAGPLFVFRIVLFTTILGLFAGYFQEKYDNNAYAIIVHMSGNTLAVVAAFIMY
jgi:membrane protease YdiL (CAAX protease family)